MSASHSLTPDRAGPGASTYEPASPLTVGVVTPHELVLGGVVRMLAPHRDRVTVVDAGGRPGSGQGALVELSLVLVDSRVGRRLDEVARRWRADGRPVVVLAHPPAPSADSLPPAVTTVPITATALELLSALERAGAHGDPSPRGPEARGSAALPAGLSAREAEVLGCVAVGMSNQEIAEELYLGVNTVKTYLRTGYAKAGVTRRSQAVAWAMRHDLALGRRGPTVHR